MVGRIAYYGNIIKDGLILNLDAAKRDSYPGSGTVWRDISGFQNNGTLINGSAFDSGNNGTISFDGINAYVSVNATHTQISLGLSNFTLSVWYNNNSTNTYHHLYNVLNQTNFAWKGNNTSVGQIYFYGGDNYRSNLNDFGEWNLDFNVWNQHTLVRDGLNQ